MRTKSIRPEWMALGAILAAGVAGAMLRNADSAETELIRYGTMHEAIGQARHHGRVTLAEVVDRPHFFGVGALAELAGEVTIHDGSVTVTGVDPGGELEARDTSVAGLQATLLAGAYVGGWTAHPIEQDVVPEAFDDLVASAAKQHEVDLTRPFVFTVDGDLTDVAFHVINGSCPRQARTRDDLPQAQRPFNGATPKVRGRLVGLYATDSAGELTHPDTTTHVHVLFAGPSGETVTAHVDRVGLAAGAVLNLPR